MSWACHQDDFDYIAVQGSSTFLWGIVNDDILDLSKGPSPEHLLRRRWAEEMLPGWRHQVVGAGLGPPTKVLLQVVCHLDRVLGVVTFRAELEQHKPLQFFVLTAGKEALGQTSSRNEDSLRLLSGAETWELLFRLHLGEVIWDRVLLFKS